jgi:hypothetical protein
MWADLEETAALWSPHAVVEPENDRAAERARWADAIDRATGWIPELSALDF